MHSISLVEFPWLRDVDKRLFWGEFLKLFHHHLKARKKIDTFYFNLLLLSVQKWDKAKHKRIICEGYINILKHEKRVKPLRLCDVCKEPFEEHISLIDRFVATHPKCTNSHPISTKKVVNFFNTNNSIFLDDDEIERLLEVIMRGF